MDGDTRVIASALASAEHPPTDAALRAGDLPLRLIGQVSPTPRVDYRMHTFTLAPGVTRLTVRLHFHKERLCQLFLAVFDPHAYRGTRYETHPHAPDRAEVISKEEHIVRS